MVGHLSWLRMEETAGREANGFFRPLPVPRVADAQQPKVVDLMAALEASLAAVKRERS